MKYYLKAVMNALPWHSSFHSHHDYPTPQYMLFAFCKKNPETLISKNPD